MDGPFRSFVSYGWPLSFVSFLDGPFLLFVIYEWPLSFYADVKGSTQLQYRQVTRSLIKFFGDDKRLDSITVADAERWRIHVRQFGSGRKDDPG